MNKPNVWKGPMAVLIIGSIITMFYVGFAVYIKKVNKYISNYESDKELTPHLNK